MAKPDTDRYWSARVTRESNALDLEAGVFTLRSPGAIARSLHRSALASRRRKGTALQSAIVVTTPSNRFQVDRDSL